MDMRFGTRNFRSLYRAGALGLVTSKIDSCRMDMVGVQEVRWEGSGTLESRNYTLIIKEKKFSPGPGIEPGSPALRTGVITTKPPKLH